MNNGEETKIVDLSYIKRTALYTIDELAPLLRVSERTLRRYCIEKVFPNAVKMGGKNWVIPGCDVIALCPFLADQGVISESS
ncbi:MAG: helix-turn-helix domain-containing protein [Deltaproteobacteria bacterium]|nr:helix-turn-helix domain-containing protein [Deltaproteobacteria bacterium]